MPHNTRARSDEIAAAARAILDAAAPALDQRVPFEELAPLLVEQTGCHPNSARRHLARAMRLKRGEAAAAWGGTRSGAGNPALTKGAYHAPRIPAADAPALLAWLNEASAGLPQDHPASRGIALLIAGLWSEEAQSAKQEEHNGNL